MLRHNSKDQVLFVFGFLVLAFIALFNSHPLTFDEVLFPRNVLLMERLGFTKQFLLEMYDQAPGPLYQFIHLPLMPLTGLEPPAIRAVNIVLFLVLMVVLIGIVKIINPEDKSLFKSSHHLIAIPMIWTVTGLVLTEIPAMLFAALSLYFCLLAFVKLDEKPLYKMLAVVFGGVCLGLAILGRSPYLMMIIGYGIYGFYLNRQNRLNMALIITIGLSMCIPIFYIWGGLMPPAQMHTGEGGLNIWHGILGVSYTALVLLFIAPTWYTINKRILIWLAGGFMVTLILNFFVLHFEYHPLSYTLAKVLPEYFVLEVYPYLIAPLFICTSGYFAYMCLIHAWEKREDRYFILFLSLVLVMIGTSVKITHLFSSRYVAQAAPFLVLVGYYFPSKGIYKNLLFVLGMLIGFFSLTTYAEFTL